MAPAEYGACLGVLHQEVADEDCVETHGPAQ
jgi:hypothetical protein